MSAPRLSPFGVARLALEERTPFETWLDDLVTRASRAFDLGPEHAALAHETLAWAPGLDEVERRALVLLVLASLVARARGSTRLPVRGEARARFLEAIVGELVEREEKSAALAAIDTLLASGRAAPVIGERRPLVLDGDALYHEKLLRSEKRFATAVASLLRSTPEPRFDEAQVRAQLEGSSLSDEQRAAVVSAVTRPLTVVTGGPGTGKTSIVKTVLRVLGELGLAPHEIALAAPTGKAAQRLGESATTIHRLLGASRDGSYLRHHESNQLEARVVIVDEASMIDMELMERLVRAIRPGARLVLLGDAQQLPSVGSGAVLRDLIPLDQNVVFLTRNFRQSRDHFEETFVPSVRGLLETWYRERLASLEGFDELLSHSWDLTADASQLGALFTHYESARLLCVTRVGRTGADVVNEVLRAFHLSRRRAPARFELTAGEPVLVLVNDYEKGLWNGDQGVVLRVHGRFSAVFRRRDAFVAFPLELLRGKVERCFAMTVHKAQGSEFDHVALILPDEDVPLLGREILYTAVTRARRSVVIAGKRELWDLGRERTIERSSGAGERVRAALT